MAIIIPVGLNEADPDASCCMECCKVGCCACAVSGCLDVDILTWSDVGPSGDLVTSSCASGGGLSFTMCPRLDICGCKQPVCNFSEWNTNCFDKTYCYEGIHGDLTPGQSSPYPSGLCTGGSSGDPDDYPQMWGFSGTVCGSCTSCGEPAYDAENCGGACIWAAYCCPAASDGSDGKPLVYGISSPAFAWGSYPCYDIPPICPSGSSGGSGYGCDTTRENRQVACSPCATRLTNRCVPYNCPYNRSGPGIFGTSPSAVCGWTDCCDGFLPIQNIEGCGCTEPEWHLYPTGSTDGCQNAGWPATSPCQLYNNLGAAGWPMMYEELGNWPDTCFTFVSGQCSIPPIGQKFIAVYEGWMANYHCDCQTRMCCDYGFDVDYECDANPSLSPCWMSGSPGGTGTISVDCDAYSCLRTDHSIPGQAADPYSQDIYARIIITES